jgi:hypothetical protein
MTDQMLAASAPPLVDRWAQLRPPRFFMRLLHTLIDRDQLDRVAYTVGTIVLLIGLVPGMISIVTVLPDGSSVAGVADFYAKYRPWIDGVLLLTTVGALVIITIVGSFAARLWQADRSRRHVLSWTALASDLMLFAIFFLTAGFCGAAAVAAHHVPDTIVYTLHMAAFASAFVLAGVWLPFFAATYVVSRRFGLLPRGLELILILCGILNTLAVAGDFTLHGSFNAANGWFSLALPSAGDAIWMTLSATWMVVQELRELAARHPAT